jgi:putative inorganic carbon (hco3(-)) transporter
LNRLSLSKRVVAEPRAEAKASRWNAILCVSSLECFVAAGLWLVWPELGPWPLILVALALVARQLTTRTPILGTPFDRPLFLFLCAAAVGAWLAYSQQAGWNKFWLIVAGVAVYTGIVYLPDEIDLGGWRRISPSRMLLIAVPAVISLYSLLSTDWLRWAEKLSWLNPLRSWMITLRPTFPGYDLHPNVAGGILAALIPLQLAALFSVKRSRVQMWLGGLCLGLSALGLFMSAARGAWLSLDIVLTAWGLWWVSGQVVQRRKGISDPRLRHALWAVVGAILVATICAAVVATPLRTQLAELDGRLTLWRNSLDLALDYPLSGLGLASFEMPYSSYVLLVHVGYLTHAHNLLLDVWLGQGLLGLLGLGWLLAVAVRTGRQTSPWQHAALASLVVILMHGLMDDAFYGYDGRGVVLLFVPFALLARPVTMPGASRPRQADAKRQIPYVVPILGGVAAVLAGAALMHPGSRAIIQANLGALAQTRAELFTYQWPDWPIQDALRRSPEVDLEPAIAHYEAALALDPDNVAANRRLGQIELSRGQYGAAEGHLRTALAAAPWQRATRQLVGESYAINGQTELAAELWRTVDLAQGQLMGRMWWYEHLGDVERARRLEGALKLAQ